MRYLKLLYLLVGVGLLFVVLSEIDLNEVWTRTLQVGWGVVVILMLYFCSFLIDSFTWQMALTTIPLNGTWLYRVWKMRMVGEVFNLVIPAAGMGGEPVKAVLLKRYYAVGYREGAASLILAKTINLIGLVVFLSVGFAFMLATPAIPDSYRMTAGAGLIGLTIAIALFFGVQRLRLSSAAGSWLSQWRVARRLDRALHHIRDVDEQLVRFYTRYRGRFAGAVALGLVNWIIGVFEIYYTMIFLGHPVSLTEAWIIESVAQLVRAGTFFIPASIGAQEGAFVLVCSVVTGSPALGVAVSLVRRFREVVWLVWGALLALRFSLTPPVTEETGAS